MKKREIKFRTWSTLANKWIYPIFDISNNLNSNPTQHIQQFTGLLDKNGKEIYEGDIVKDLDGHISKVGWYSTSDGYDWTGFSTEIFEVNETVEIIGNIYENPELLK